MGFSKGTEIFDSVADTILDTDGNIRPVIVIEDVLESLYKALRDADWDTYDEPYHCSSKVYKDIMKRQGDWDER